MKVTRIMHLFLYMICSLLTIGCGSGNDVIDDENNDVVVSAPSVSNVTFSTADLSAGVTGKVLAIKKGFCYSTTENNTASSSTVEVSSGFSVSVSNLTAGTVYYVKAYVYDGSKFYYSAQTKFTTLTKSLTDELNSYVAPTYKDDYTAASGWDSRSSWNLANVHDPTVMKADDGYFYMYQTDASYGNAHSGHGHFFCRRSKNLVDWEFLGSTMPSLPSWVKTKLNEIRTTMGLGVSSANFSDETQFGFWAPCVRKVKTGLYRMYYVITVPGTINGTGTWSERAFIGLMETSNPSNVGSWVDKGYVITNVSDKGLNYKVSSTDWANCYFKFNAIDPSYIVTSSGEHWLVYGSWHSGFAAVQLNADTGKPLKELGNPWGSDISAYGKLVNTRQMGNRWQASEAPEVVYHDGYYYMFMAYDELSVAYNTRVVRSKNIDGPYVGINGIDVTNYGGDAYPIVTHPYKFSQGYGWVGISHCAVFDDGEGNWYFASQGRFPANVGGNAYSNAIMMGQVRSIRWTEDGWPLVMPERYGAVPQADISESDLVGNWENIELSYSYGKQKESATLTLAANHTISAGIWKGATWSYDTTNRVLTANGVKLYLQRECDWESSPRNATIVYAGYTTTKTYWGKKIK